MNRKFVCFLAFLLIFSIVGCSTVNKDYMIIQNQNYSYVSESSLDIDSLFYYEEPYLKELRTKYDLDNMVAHCETDFEKIKVITEWVTNLWKHDGMNMPSNGDPITILNEVIEQGQEFRCVEYATVI